MISLRFSRFTVGMSQEVNIFRKGYIMGSSLLTNRSSLTALQTLRQIDRSMNTTQQRISTGLRINQAMDNTAYWSISSMMRTDKIALGSIAYVMDLSKEQVHTAYESVVKSKEYLDQIEESLAIALGTGEGDLKKIQNDIRAHIDGIKTALYSAAMAEKNMLLDDGNIVRISGSYRREGDKLYIDMIEIGGPNLNFGKPVPGGSFDLTGGVFKNVFGKGSNSKEMGEINTAGEAVEKAQKDLAAASDDAAKDAAKAELEKAKEDLKNAIGDMTLTDFVNLDLKGINAAALEGIASHLQEITIASSNNALAAGAELGAAEKRIDTQVDFLSKLTASLDKGIGALVDADMNAESARLSALQVQQQLAIQSLAIANQNSQNILTLFRN
ncbi:MAG: flagellin [Candidatus Tokpelaia sp. JSC188]|nr:MAG: flagellin [Candidatus Tokpelaia sp. JSC188]